MFAQTTTKPAPALRPEEVRSGKIYRAISEGYRVDPRYVEALMATIEAKLEIADKLYNDKLKTSTTEEYETVKAYQDRGSQAEIMNQAQEQLRISRIYAENGQDDLSRWAREKHDALMASWRAYQITAKF